MFLKKIAAFRNSCSVKLSIIFVVEILAMKFLPQACNFNKKETLAQVLSCEFCEFFKNTYFEEHLRTTASEFICVSSVTEFSKEQNKRSTSTAYHKHYCYRTFLADLP